MTKVSTHHVSSLSHHYAQSKFDLADFHVVYFTVKHQLYKLDSLHHNVHDYLLLKIVLDPLVEANCESQQTLTSYYTHFL